MESEVKEGFNPVKVFLKNLIIEFIFTFLLLMILSVLLSLTSISESVINPSIIFISAFSILIGSFCSARKIGTKGILIGILQGVIYMLILYLFSSISNGNFAIGSSSLIMILIGVVCGALGGILGVNLKSNI